MPIIKNENETRVVSQSPSINPACEEERKECSVCKVPIPSKYLDLHTSRCVLNQNNIPTEQIRKKRPTLPKLVYSILKDSELKKKCKEFGLNPKGARKQLISRLQKYTLLYNAECQLDEPKSQMAIRMQVEREELQEKNAVVLAPRSLQYDRKTESAIIEQKQKEYLKENKQTFADMIEQVRNRRKPPPKIDEQTTSLKETSTSDIDIIEEICVFKDHERGSIEDLSKLPISKPVFEYYNDQSGLVNDHCGRKRTLSPKKNNVHIKKQKNKE